MRPPIVPTLSISPEPIDDSALYKAFIDQPPFCGAASSFLGKVRSDSHEGDVTGLYIDWYPPLTRQSLLTIAHEAMSRFCF